MEKGTSIDLDLFKQRCEWAMELLAKQSEQDEIKEAMLMSGANDEEASAVITEAKRRIELIKKHCEYAIQLINKQYKYNEVKQFVVDEGVSEEDARFIITEAAKKLKYAKKKIGKELMLAGCILVLLGVITTILSYFFTWLNHGRTYFLYYGAVVSGVVVFFRGLNNSK